MTAPARPQWGTIGFSRSVELGIGIAVGFWLISAIVGFFVLLIRLSFNPGG